jgi:D-beta-D-heptose 7-phosphate kinase/D-beta-D-heptose 1-phosphate adenosyltransferase
MKTLEKPALTLDFEHDITVIGGEKPSATIHAATRDIFGPGANPKRRYLSSFEQVEQYANFLKGLGLKVVYTSGVWDLPHIGHCRYMEKAKQLGDILIVGTELDEAVAIRKGPQRPVVPFNERVEMLCHIRHIDLVVPIADYDKKGLSGNKMLEAIKPNVFVFSKRSLDENSTAEGWIKEIKPYCDHIEILESQAETSTSAKIRGLMMDLSEYVKDALEDAEKAVSKAVAKAFTDVKDRVDDAAKKA